MIKRAIAIRAGMLATCLALAAFLLSPGSALAKDQTRPVVLVHGFEGSGVSNCTHKWGDLMTMYRKWGFTGPFLPVLYYAGDTACKPRSQYGAMLPVRIASGTNDTHIQTYSRDWAWFIYNNFSSHGQPVNVVAHSMGGLIVRYAIAAVQMHKKGFPPFVVVPSVVTFGTPHAGIKGYKALGCYALYGAYECLQFWEEVGQSGFIGWLEDHAQNPQGAYGTWWSVAGSHADDNVGAKSAVAMSAPYKIRWASEVAIEHGDFMHDQAVNAFNVDAHCWSTTSGANYGDMSEGTCYHPLQWSGTILAAYGY